MKNETRNVKYYQIPVYCSPIIHGKNKHTNSYNKKLYKLRKYFSGNNTKFILLKIIIGLLFLGIPVICFKLILNSKNNFENEFTSYTSATLPLYLSTIFILLGIVTSIIHKISSIFKNRFIFPTWERNSLGEQFCAFIVVLFIFSFLNSLNNSLNFLNIYKETLIDNFKSDSIITSIVSKIFLYNAFDNKILLLNDTYNNFLDSNSTTPLQNNSTNHNLHKFELLQSYDGLYDKSKIIIEILLSLLSPFVLLSILALVKVSLYGFILDYFVFY